LVWHKVLDFVPRGAHMLFYAPRGIMNSEYLKKLERSREIASGLLHDDELAAAFEKRIAEYKEHVREPLHETLEYME